MMEEKILTKHPAGKTGRKIDVTNYEMMKKSILTILGKKELTHTELINLVYKDLKDKFEKNIHWYAETVKLDLEARKIIERTPSKPQKYRLKK